jgi:hypothetical protein
MTVTRLAGIANPEAHTPGWRVLHLRLWNAPLADQFDTIFAGRTQLRRAAGPMIGE